MDLTLNNLQRLIWHKNQTNQPNCSQTKDKKRGIELVILRIQIILLLKSLNLLRDGIM